MKQSLMFLNNENLNVECDALLIFINDKKYDYQAICLLSLYLDSFIDSEKLSFNSFLIPLKYIDSIKIDYEENCFRVIPSDNEGLFYSNNAKNLDIINFANLFNFEPKMIIKMKNQAFLSDEKFKNLIKNCSKFIGLDESEVLKLKNEKKDLIFASQKNLNDDKSALVRNAKKLVGMRIVRDSQNSTFDCASFVSYLFMSELGIDIQMNGFGKSTTGKVMTSQLGKCFLIDEDKPVSVKCDFILKNAEVGDVLMFHSQSANYNFVSDDNKYPGHVAIYIGDGKYIDARHKRGDVRIVDINDDEYMHRFIGFKRFLFEKSMQNEPFENEKG